MSNTGATAGARVERWLRTPAGGVDVFGTISLLGCHALLGLLSLLATFVLSYGDPCPPPGCHGSEWNGLAVVLTLPVAGLVFLADAVVAIVFMALRRRAFYLPVIGCLVQVALLVVAFAIAG